jgi:hypothetical protein
MQYNANQDVRRVRRYFIGTTELSEGQILALDHDASATDSDPKLRLGSAVEVLTANNLKMVQGIVPLSEAGKTGPCFVELLAPQAGDVVSVLVDGGTVDVTAGDVVEPDNTAAALVNGTEAVGEFLFVALETNTGTAALKLCMKV